MIPELSVSIVHARFDPGRRVMLKQLLASLAPELHLIAGPYVSTDDDRAGSWVPARRAWRWAASCRTPWHVQLQDDALLCLDFVAGLVRALRALPASAAAVAPYSPRAVVTEALRHGGSWALVPDGCVGPAIVLPTNDIADFLCWESDAFRPALGSADSDSRVNWWLLERGRPAWVTCPSLVEHADGDASLLGGGEGRRARWFLGADRSALDINWSAGLGNPPTEAAGLTFPRSYVPPEKRKRLA